VYILRFLFLNTPLILHSAGNRVLTFI
jgi:hypothetical protein